MKISVIIPFFNNHKTLPKTLESLSKQSLKVFEIILIDDCSKNQKELEKIVDKYSRDLPLRLLKNTQNSNGAYSRNKGILASKGDVVAFSDADDIWLPNKTKLMIEFIKKVGLNFVFFSKAKILKNGVLTDSRPKSFNNNVHISEYLFLEDGFIQTSTIFCSAEIAKQIMFNENFKRHQDYDFVLRASNMGFKFHFIPQDLVVYRADSEINLNKGEGYMYSKVWLEEMKVFFSSKGYLGFKIFNLTARLLKEKRYIKAGLNFFEGFFKLKISEYSRMIPKIKRIAKMTLSNNKTHD
jgi:amylovoran biosynthesis glycosyltransferase AmsB